VHNFDQYTADNKPADHLPQNSVVFLLKHPTQKYVTTGKTLQFNLQATNKRELSKLLLTYTFVLTRVFPKVSGLTYKET